MIFSFVFLLVNIFYYSYIGLLCLPREVKSLNIYLKMQQKIGDCCLVGWGRIWEELDWFFDWKMRRVGLTCWWVRNAWRIWACISCARCLEWNLCAYVSSHLKYLSLRSPHTPRSRLQIGWWRQHMNAWFRNSIRDYFLFRNCLSETVSGIRPDYELDNWRASS